MKQILQSAKSGELELAEVPVPALQPGHVLVRNQFSVVSPGTEKLMMAFARKSVLRKAQSRPDLVRQVVRKLRNDGPLATYQTVMTRLDAPQPLGYSCAGVVEDVGEGVTTLSPGDRVACAGAGYANHAEIVVVPENLVASVPEGVSLESAAFSTIGAIAMQGLRVSRPQLGEIAVVVGLGLIGQLTVMLLKANGCRVLGIDIDAARVQWAQHHGAEWAFTSGSIPDAWQSDETGGYGADFAIVTAASSNSVPIELAAALCRHKGRVTLVGMMPMELDRRTFYDKELELRMSTSYGPGRYDRSYEELGLDYPLPYVRWTENRNLQSFLALVGSGAVVPGSLDTRTVSFSESEQTYEDLAKGRLASLAVVFQYDCEPDRSRTIELAQGGRSPIEGDRVGISFIGAGNYAKGMLLPILQKRSDLRWSHLVASTGPSAKRTAQKFSFSNCGTDADAPLADRETDLVFVATRHDSHASLAEGALRAGKAVWLEKPAGLTRDEVESLADAARETGGFLMIGYNRRFSRHTRAIRRAFQNRSGPLAIHYVVAAGATPSGTWIVDPAEGGGRIIGEGCHFVDLCAHLVGMAPSSVYARALRPDPQLDDSTVLMLGFPDGSTAVIEYLAATSPDLVKERFEVSGDGRTARCENFRVTRISGAKTLKTLNQDKGQATAIDETLSALRAGAPSPICIEEILAISQATFAAVDSMRTASPISLQGAGAPGRTKTS